MNKSRKNGFLLRSMHFFYADYTIFLSFERILFRVTMFAVVCRRVLGALIGQLHRTGERRQRLVLLWGRHELVVFHYETLHEVKGEIVGLDARFLSQRPTSVGSEYNQADIVSSDSSFSR